MNRLVLINPAILQRVLDDAAYIKQEDRQAIHNALSAPAEDFRAVVEEPVAWRGCNSDGEVVTEWIDGAPPAQMFDLCGNAGSFGKIELAYSRPQRPFVLPERYDESQYRGASLLAVRRWNACIDEFEGLNK